MRDRLTTMTELAHENLAEAQRQQKAYYDRKAKDRSFEPGDKVLVLLPTGSGKLTAEWQGPYTVTKKVGPVDYEVDLKGKRKRFRTLHIKAWHTPKEGSVVALEAL